MYGPLIIAAFEKAGKEIGKSRKYPQAAHLTLLIQELRLGETVTERTLVGYYDDACRDIEVEIPIRMKIKDALLKYLGYAVYEDFIKDYSAGGNREDGNEAGVKKDVKESRGKRIRIVISISITLLLIFGVFAIYKYRFEFISSPRMMVWKGDRYEEVSLDLREYRVQELKFFREDLIVDFRKIQPDCKTTFFDAHGGAQLWYGKNSDGNLEFFTALAKHPETGKSLKEITPYMIRKYICDTY